MPPRHFRWSISAQDWLSLVVQTTSLVQDWYQDWCWNEKALLCICDCAGGVQQSLTTMYYFVYFVYFTYILHTLHITLIWLIMNILHILHIFNLVSTKWLNKCQSNIIYKHWDRAQALFVIPVSSILWHLLLVPVGPTGTISFEIGRESADFLGAARDKAKQAGDSCRWCHVKTAWPFLSLGTKHKCNSWLNAPFLSISSWLLHCSRLSSACLAESWACYPEVLCSSLCNGDANLKKGVLMTFLSHTTCKICKAKCKISQLINIICKSLGNQIYK